MRKHRKSKYGSSSARKNNHRHYEEINLNFLDCQHPAAPTNKTQYSCGLDDLYDYSHIPQHYHYYNGGAFSPLQAGYYDDQACYIDVGQQQEQQQEVEHMPMEVTDNAEEAGSGGGGDATTRKNCCIVPMVREDTSAEDATDAKAASESLVPHYNNTVAALTPPPGLGHELTSARNELLPPPSLPPLPANGFTPIETSATSETCSTFPALLPLALPARDQDQEQAATKRPFRPPPGLEHVLSEKRTKEETVLRLKAERLLFLPTTTSGAGTRTTSGATTTRPPPPSTAAPVAPFPSPMKAVVRPQRSPPQPQPTPPTLLEENTEMINKTNCNDVDLEVDEKTSRRLVFSSINILPGMNGKMLVEQ
eukprot:g18787.t1